MNRYLVILTLLIISTNGFSQDKYGYLTIKYGRSYSWLKYTNVTKDFNSEFLEYPVWQVGYSHPISSVFALGMGVNFTRRGASLMEDYQTYHILADYVDLSFTVDCYFLGQKKFIQPYIHIAPTWGTCIGGEIYNSLEKPFYTQLNTTNYSKFNYSFNYGLGLDFKVPTGKLGVEIVHELGLSNTYSKNDFYDYQGETRKHRAYYVTLKYSLSTRYIAILIDELSYLIWKINNPKFHKSVRQL